jgi:hypothetical protein
MGLPISTVEANIRTGIVLWLDNGAFGRSNSYRPATPAAFSTATRIAACFSTLNFPPSAVT